MQDQRAINLQEDEESNLTADVGGKEKTYYPHRQYVWVACESLQVQQRIKSREGASAEAPQLATTVVGQASLSHDELGLIGEPDVSTRTIGLLFHVDERPYKLSRASDENSFIDQFATSGRATLSFNRAHWESFSSDDWLLTCGVSRALFDGIVASVNEGKLRAMSLAFQPEGLWTDRHPMFSAGGTDRARAHIFLRPRTTDNSSQFPEPSAGGLMVLNLSLSRVEFEHARSSEPVADAPQAPVAAAVPSERFDWLLQLGFQFDRMRTTIKWVGGLITVALLILALR